MTREAAYWPTVRDHLSPFGVVRRIENGVGGGDGDVIYCLTRPKPGSTAATGFIELKSLPAYPAKRSTPIRPPHLSKDQVLFAEEWAAAGGRAWLLLRAPPWTMLFDVPAIRMLYQGEVAAMDGPAVARVAAMGRFPTGPIFKCLTA
jgi:hypothetical protein